MSEKNKEYKVSVAKSNKKSKKIVDTFKVRKSGNSSIVTVPDEVKEELNIKDGDQIQYVTVKDNKHTPVVIVKRSESEDEVDDEVKETFKQSMEKYDDIITALAEL